MPHQLIQKAGLGTKTAAKGRRAGAGFCREELGHHNRFVRWMGNGARKMSHNDANLCARAQARGITIYQRSKTVWIAAGSHRGQDFEVKGRSPAIALAFWVEAARYRGSGI